MKSLTEEELVVITAAVQNYLENLGVADYRNGNIIKESEPVPLSLFNPEEPLARRARTLWRWSYSAGVNQQERKTSSKGGLIW
ncbi:MAG: hypothetical protein AB1599_10990 [Planctomycetota bacterium]